MNNINEYLESLPLDATIIELCHMNLNNIPDLSRFTNVTKLDCSCNELT
jgi:Leucine-rich repeat (LRR) protein